MLQKRDDYAEMKKFADEAEAEGNEYKAAAYHRDRIAVDEDDPTGW